MKVIEIPKNTRTTILAPDNIDNLTYVLRQNSEAAIVMPINETVEKTVQIRLVEPNARAEFIGVSYLKNQKARLHTFQLHEAPVTYSNLLVKSVLADNSEFIYEGTIRVEKIAQKTDAYQRNDNLLLSETAVARTSPILEIEVGDVKCTHGATVAPADPEQLWYLSTRGLDEDRAKQLIFRGFLESAVYNLDNDIKSKIMKYLFFERSRPPAGGAGESRSL